MKAGVIMFFQEYRNRINETEGVQFPSNSYRQMVLQPAYDEAKTALFNGDDSNSYRAFKNVRGTKISNAE